MEMYKSPSLDRTALFFWLLNNYGFLKNCYSAEKKDKDIGEKNKIEYLSQVENK